MNVLAIETSSNTGSVAVRCDSETTFCETFSAERGSSTRLFVVLESALQLAPGCDRLAVGVGPGSYSGVRVAIAAAIGLQFALRCELVGIPSIAGYDLPEYHVIGDARRGAFYFAHVRNGECLASPELLTPDELRPRLGALPVVSAAPTSEFPAAMILPPSAEIIARLATQDRCIVARDMLEPLYLRAPHITQPKHIRPLQ